MLQAMIIFLSVAIGGVLAVALGQYRVLRKSPVRTRSELLHG